MKAIKSSLLGFKKLDDSDGEVLMLQLQEVLSQHQEILINRLLTDLPAYIDYRFHVKPSRQELEEIKGQLNFIKHRMIDLEMFPDVVAQVMRNTTTHLRNEVFYASIDKILQLHPKDKALSVL